MSSQEEMRRVMLHAAEKLNAAKDAKIKTGYNEWSLMPGNVLVAIGYAAGVLELLASYLKVEDQATPSTNGQSKATDPGQVTAEKAERNRAVVVAIEAGEHRQVVAERFGISERRVRQIVEAHERKATADET